MVRTNLWAAFPVSLRTRTEPTVTEPATRELPQMADNRESTDASERPIGSRSCLDARRSAMRRRAAGLRRPSKGQYRPKAELRTDPLADRKQALNLRHEFGRQQATGAGGRRLRAESAAIASLSQCQRRRRHDVGSIARLIRDSGGTNHGVRSEPALCARAAGGAHAGRRGGRWR
jgi:hypothetical protein